MSIDTGKAKLPALPPVRVDDASLQRWIQAVTERLEVREGSRGNAYERSVTVRDLEAALRNLEAEGDTVVQSNGDLKIKIGGMNATISVQQFADAIRQTRLYRDLLTRLDDPNRFNSFPSEIRNILLKSISEEAAQRGADIRRLETKIEDSNRSVAIKVEEVTAALGANQAGIREVQAAYVNSTQATATQVTQLESSLGNYYQDGTPGRALLEEELTTQASFVDGLRAQYTLKVQAGGALAGFGVAAEEINGVPSSAFLISADKFAIVSPDYAGGLTNSPNLNNIPFGVDASGVYINGQVRINATGLELQQVSRSVSLSAPTNVFKQNSSGAWDGSSITITANKLGGLTATPVWSVVSGSYSGSLPSGNALSVARTSMNTDVVVFRATATQDGFNYSDDFTIARLADGSNSITAILSNDAHSVSADASGNVTSYTGSGTQIRVYEGATELAYNGSGTTNGTWTVSAAGSGITPGSITDSGTFATVSNHANFLTAADTATITYAISGRTAGGSAFSVNKTQSFSKSKTGAQGIDGADGPSGPRGSMTFYATGSVWSNTTANNIVTSVTGSSTRIIGDTVTISNGSTFAETRYWSGIDWVAPGVVIDGNLLVNGTISGSKIAANTINGDRIVGGSITGDKINAGTITADKIDSRNLTIKDSSGNVIFGAGTDLSINNISGLGSLATQNSVSYSSVTGTKPPTNADRTADNIAAGISGQGALATEDFAAIGSTVKIYNGSTARWETVNWNSFVNYLSKINSSNISTFMESAAIGNAYIGNAAISNAKIQNAAVNTLKIDGNAVTVSASASGSSSASFTISTSYGGALIFVMHTRGSSGTSGASVLRVNGGTYHSYEGYYFTTYVDQGDNSIAIQNQTSSTSVFRLPVGAGTFTCSLTSGAGPVTFTGLLTQR